MSIMVIEKHNIICSYLRGTRSGFRCCVFCLTVNVFSSLCVASPDSRLRLSNSSERCERRRDDVESWDLRVLVVLPVEQ